MVTREDILKQGYVDVKCNVSGLRQQHRLEVKIEKTTHGMVPFLVAKYYIPSPELIRLSEALQLPIKHKETAFFPKGKAPSDFVLKEHIVAQAEPDVIEAEVEE